jgi:prepilin-type processing-associated H-X9-DG protein
VLSPEPSYPPPPVPTHKRSPAWVSILGWCFCMFLGIPVLASLLLPFVGGNQQARSRSCLSNEKQMAMATLMYMQDADDRIPLCSTWMDMLAPYLKVEHVFHCPEISGENKTLYGYAFNSGLGHRQMGNFMYPDKTIILYDSSNLHRNATDPQASMPIPERHGDSNNVAYLDGHAKPVSPLQGF